MRVTAISGILLALLGLPLSAGAVSPDSPCAAAVKANAADTFTTCDFFLPVADPDDSGNPVALDVRVLIPEGAGPSPGLLINHGYLGDKSGDSGLAKSAAGEGWIVMRYSSRGWGQTKGQVDLVGPREVNDMLSALDWLNDAAHVPVWSDHLAQYGGSYGGAHALALARVGHPAVRAIIAAATWTQLYDDLAPYDVLKIAYEQGFYVAGRLRTDGYNNYSVNVDSLHVKVNAGIDLDGARAFLFDRGLAGKWDRVQTPLYLIQGLNDGLFAGNTAIAAFRELSARGKQVWLYLGGIGHPPATTGGPEVDLLQNERARSFLDHFVRGIDNGFENHPRVEYAPTKYFGNVYLDANRVADGFPLGSPASWQLCGSGTPGAGALSAEPCPDALPAVIAWGTGGRPGDEPVGGQLVAQGWEDYLGTPFPTFETPVDVVAFESAPLAEGVHYAGIPSLRLQVASSTPTSGLGGPTLPTAAYQIVPKVYDVSPEGHAELITRGAYSAQVWDGAPGAHVAEFDAFAMAWTFAGGHRIRVTLASADVPYLKPNPTPFVVAVLPGSAIDFPGAENTRPGTPGSLP